MSRSFPCWEEVLEPVTARGGQRAAVALRGAAAHAVRGDAMGWRLAMRSRRRALLGVAKRKLGAAVYAMGAGTGL